MLIGLDVGGTYTDAVLIDEGKWSEAVTGGKPLKVKSVKAATRPDSVLPGVLEALEKILEGEDPEKVKRVCVSSTLGLNCLLTGNETPTAVLAVPGPGIDLNLVWGDDPLFKSLAGAMDHRGKVVAPVSREEAVAALKDVASAGAEACAVICKFSPKNPEIEHFLRNLAREELGADAPIACGAESSGVLNFPRRMQTAYCNASLSNIAKSFSESLKEAAAKLGLSCPVVIMKADAGVFSNDEAFSQPADTMGSGPAASLMGVVALMRSGKVPSNGDLLMVDMGGTSTDLALLTDGHPLLAREGLNVAGRATLIRSLWTRSIALGGDSPLYLTAGREGGEEDGRTAWNNYYPIIGEGRQGPAISLAPDDLGKRPPTLTDALNVLGLADLGDTSVSFQAISFLAREVLTCGPSEEEIRELARIYAGNALERIKKESGLLVAEVNEQPVYTIRELLVERSLKPETFVFIGGPANAMTMAANDEPGTDWTGKAVAPEGGTSANALGAALARPTSMADLYADTMLQRMNIPSLGVEKEITDDYNIDLAKEDLVKALARLEDGSAPQPQIVFAETFNVLEEGKGRGKILKARAQLAPGLIGE